MGLDSNEFAKAKIDLPSYRSASFLIIPQQRKPTALAVLLGIENGSRRMRSSQLGHS